MATYNDINHKASYLFTYIINYECSDPKNVTADPKFKMLQQAIKEVTGHNPTIGNLEGYIDHQSQDVAKEVFDQGIEDIKYFIFNGQNFLKTSNDND